MVPANTTTGMVAVEGVEDRMVEGIEEVRAHVEGPVFSDGKVLVQREIHKGNSVVP